MKRRQRLAAVLALCIAMLPAAAAAQAADPAGDAIFAPADAPQPDKTVRDPDFGVAARHFGLERRVEMYQWQLTGQGYARVWSDEPVDSSRFAPGHDNPPFPLRGMRWRAGSISIDGKPLDAGVLETLGRWRDFRPSFNALPGNLAATFQPQGDGLGSAENPLAPQVGDLRITWRELVLPPLQDVLVLRDGRWRLRASWQLAGADGNGPTGEAGRATSASRRLPWLLGGGLLAILVAAVAVVRRRLRKR